MLKLFLSLILLSTIWPTPPPAPSTYEMPITDVKVRATEGRVIITWTQVNDVNDVAVIYKVRNGTPYIFMMADVGMGYNEVVIVDTPDSQYEFSRYDDHQKGDAYYIGYTYDYGPYYALDKKVNLPFVVN